MKDALIFDAVRTPRGRGKVTGALHPISPVVLATQVLQHLRDRNFLRGVEIEDVALGCVSAVGEQGALIARVAAINADFPYSTAAIHVNRFCGSALEAVNIIATKVMSGEIDLGIGGGVESMSRVPIGSDGGAWAMDPDIAFKSHYIPQGVSADLIASLYGFSRESCDEIATESHLRAARSWEEGRFARSIVPVRDILGAVLLSHDESIRDRNELGSIGQLEPSFAKQGQQLGFDSIAIQKYPELECIDHVHHAGNSSGLADGASGVLIGNAETARKFGLKPRARIVSTASIGSDPTIMLTGPEFAAKKALQRAGMSVSDIELWEVNEAFAAVVLRFVQAMNVQYDSVNVNGGAIAMGHPTGATGGMILGTLLDEMERTNKSLGLATLCIGGGMGTATIIERIN